MPFPGSALLGLDAHHQLQPGESWSLLFRISRYIPDPIFAASALLPNQQMAPQGDKLFHCLPLKMRELMAPCGSIGSYLAAAPRSNHPGGVNVVTLDGRTAFIANDINGVALAYLVSINDAGRSTGQQ